MKSVKVIRVPGYNPGEVVSLSDGAADTYCRNGQAEPEGWSLDDKERTEGPQNRMLDTGRPSKTRSRPVRRRTRTT